MKSVGKQLQEARLARNWTPELASRETKIKLERLRDLEADDYTHFTSPAYARGFVRTYARALSLDEYKILRQLDNKLPEEDHSSLVHDSGMPLAPLPPLGTEHVTDKNSKGLFVIMGLGLGVASLLAFVMFEAYRSGDLPRYFGHTSEAATAAADATNAPTVEAKKALPVDVTAPDITAARALPVDPNATPPPVAPPASAPADASATPAAAPATTTAAAPASTPATNAASAAPPAVAANPPTDVVPGTARALPVDLSQLNNPPANGPTVAVGAAPPTTSVTEVTATPPPPAPAHPSVSARASNARVSSDETAVAAPPRALPVDPSELTGASASPEPPPVPVSASATYSSAPVNAPSNDAGANSTPILNDAGLPVHSSVTSSMPDSSTGSFSGKHLVLTAMHDSFLRVTAEDGNGGEKVLFASVLHGGQTVGFDGRKFAVNVGIPSVVNVIVDGVNYGPHSDDNSPETFTLESHQP